ncbi:MAG: hypothetical protein ABIR48_00220, partial [Gammaproteobacteria bacterium]
NLPPVTPPKPKPVSTTTPPSTPLRDLLVRGAAPPKPADTTPAPATTTPLSLSELLGQHWQAVRSKPVKAQQLNAKSVNISLLKQGRKKQARNKALKLNRQSPSNSLSNLLTSLNKGK